MVRIEGLQKLTLLDYPERVACTVFTGGCNFCCPFCHNGDLLPIKDTVGQWSEGAAFRIFAQTPLCFGRCLHHRRRAAAAKRAACAIAADQSIGLSD